VIICSRVFSVISIPVDGASESPRRRKLNQRPSIAGSRTSSWGETDLVSGSACVNVVPSSVDASTHGHAAYDWPYPRDWVKVRNCSWRRTRGGLRGGLNGGDGGGGGGLG
jgi:hypothetical protein